MLRTVGGSGVKRLKSRPRRAQCPACCCPLSFSSSSSSSSSVLLYNSDELVNESRDRQAASTLASTSRLRLIDMNQQRRTYSTNAVAAVARHKTVQRDEEDADPIDETLPSHLSDAVGEAKLSISELLENDFAVLRGRVGGKAREGGGGRGGSTTVRGGGAPPPTVADFDALRPRFPWAASDEATRQFVEAAKTKTTERIVYEKEYAKAMTVVDSALHKRNLREVLRETTGSDLTSVHSTLRATVRMSDRAVQIKNKRHKPTSKRTKSPKPSVRARWATHGIAYYTKEELTKALLMLRWGLVDPLALPGFNDEKFSEDINLSAKQVFLLLSPGSSHLDDIRSRLNLEATILPRGRGTSSYMVRLRGDTADIEEAKIELNRVAAVAKKANVTLPHDIALLPPEVYQTMSRLTWTFIQEVQKAETENVLHMTSTDARHLLDVKRLLHRASARALMERATPTYIDYSETDARTAYAPLPLSTVSMPPWPINALPSLSRLSSVSSRPSSPSSQASEPSSEQLSTMIERPVVASLLPDGRTMMRALIEPFSRSHAKGNARGLLGNQHVSVDIEFGHVAWSLRPSPQSAMSEVSTAGEEAGLWSGERMLEWCETEQSFFAPAPPLDMLSVSGVLQSTASSSITSSADVLGLSSDDEKLDKLFPRLNSAPQNTGVAASEDAHGKAINEKEEATTVIDAAPPFRRVVYRALSSSNQTAPKADLKPATTLELHLEFDEAGRVIKTQRMEKRAVKLLLPTAACDVRIVAIAVSDLSTLDLADDHPLHHLLTPQAHTEAPETFFAPPDFVDYDDRRYVLEADFQVHRTKITPPPPSNDSSSAFPRIQERYRDSRPLESHRGTSVSIPLGTKPPHAVDEWERLWRRGASEVARVLGGPVGLQDAGMNVSAAHGVFNRS